MTHFFAKKCYSAQMFGQDFPKKPPKNAFFLAFFQKFACGAENLVNSLYSGLGELKKSIWSTLKKGRENFIYFFQIRPTPLEKFLDPRLLVIQFHFLKIV